jgi:hypothetical protein
LHFVIFYKAIRKNACTAAYSSVTIFRGSMASMRVLLIMMSGWHYPGRESSARKIVADADANVDGTGLSPFDWRSL